MKKFDGYSYNPFFDYERLSNQKKRVFDLMRDSMWRTIGEISTITNDPEPSVSARIRDFRKEKFGLHVVERRPRGSKFKGLWEYRLILNLGENVKIGDHQQIELF